MYYEYQRWYDPSTGRFISQDPRPGHARNPQSLNPYVYVVNQPTRLVDPSGMAFCWEPLTECEGGGGGGRGGSSTPTVSVENLPQIEVDTSATAESLAPTEAASLTDTYNQLGIQDLEDYSMGGPRSTLGGARSIELGKLGEGGTLGKLYQMGVDPETEVESHPQIELENGQVRRPDFRVTNSRVGFKGIIETKWGPLTYGDTRSYGQFIDNVRISQATRLPLYYDLYSEPDPYWQDLFRMYNVRFL